MTSDATDQQIWALLSVFRPTGSNGWVADLPVELQALTDTNEEPDRSSLRLLENGQALGPPHALHETIEGSGGGRYSFWISALHFSTSDGSDPNTNGRSYTVTLPVAAAATAPSVQRPSEAAPAWRSPSRPLRCAVYGLGNRGLRLAKLAESFARVEIAWLADHLPERIAQGLEIFGGTAQGTTNPAIPLADPAVDIVFVTVPDHAHRSVAEPAFRAGKHVFLEKPLATSIADAVAIIDAWRASGQILQLGYVLRQAPFYAAIRTIVRDGLLGAVRVASLSEQLDVRHGATFMRRWHAHSEYSGGLMVHKGCHDLDVICWLLDAQPLAVSSFGGTNTFVEPPPAQFCSQCDRRDICPYVDTALHERRTPAEAANPTAYGLDRCVFRADKDIVDNQVVSFELDTGARGTFYLAMHGPVRGERRITLIGEKARLDGVFEDGGFVVTFTDPDRPPLVWSANESSRGGHGGGDHVTMFEFLDACAGRSPGPVSSPRDAIRGLVFALAAERARRSGAIVRLDNRDFEPGRVS